ncbi:MAG: RNA-binding protein [Saprospiraceae bacterium]|jgi:RNA recognition motif-containing protein|nr:RNA-binding protein [Candidatus Opimibacter skivensis]MBP6680943.1 RNA-binding protein [Saprospiraceae bacterium]HQW03861.1 RNA-binding protein [Saprospiraceae bacterium]HQW24856.1 RNA-binding protein [Saprospiraceae bacterium]
MKLFVAKLPQNVTSERLKAMFESYGSVIDAKVITDRDTGMSKCYGFVEMATEEAARDAIDRLNGTEMDGKEVLVKESDPAPRSNDRGRGGPRPGGGGGGRPPFNSGGGGGDRRSSGPRPGGDRWGGGGGDDRNRSSNRYQDDRPKKRYDDDFDDKPRRKRI